MVDAMKDKKEYARSIFECNIKQVDLYARNHFFEGTTILIMKYIAKFNYHGVRNKQINKGIALNKCLCCY